MLRPYDQAPPPYTPPRREAAEGGGDATIDLTAEDAELAAGTGRAAAEAAALAPATVERGVVVQRMVRTREVVPFFRINMFHFDILFACNKLILLFRTLHIHIVNDHSHICYLVFPFHVVGAHACALLHFPCLCWAAGSTYDCVSMARARSSTCQCASPATQHRPWSGLKAFTSKLCTERNIFQSCTDARACWPPNGPGKPTLQKASRAQCHVLITQLPRRLA